MSTSAEPAPSSLDTVGAASTPDVPSPTPGAVKAGLKANPLTDEMKKAHDELELASKNMDPDENNNPPDPETEESALDRAKMESDRLREIMMRQQGMGRDKLGCPLLEELIKAITKILKAIFHKITFNKFNNGDPSGPAASPRLISKRNDTLKSVEDTEAVVEALGNEAEKAKKAALENNDIENDGHAPASPGAAATAPK